MTTVEPVLPAEPPPSACLWDLGRGKARRRVARLTIAFTLLFAAVAVLVPFAGDLTWRITRSTPDLFPPLEPQPQAIASRVAVGQRYGVVDALVHRDVRIRDITPLLAEGARATASVRICRGGGISPGVYAGAPVGDCGELLAPHDVRLRTDDYVIVSVVARARGTVDLRGLRIAVSRGSRHWHEDTGMFLRLLVH